MSSDKEAQLIKSLQDRLNTLGTGIAPPRCAAHVCLSENDAAFALFSQIGYAARALLTDIIGQECALHFDSRAAYMSTAPLEATAARARPDIVAVTGLERDRPTPAVIAEMKGLRALPDSVLCSAAHLPTEGWRAALTKENQLQVHGSGPRHPYALRPATALAHRLGTRESTLAINVLDLGAYVPNLGLEYGVLTNGNVHALVLVNDSRRSLFVSHPFGRGIATPRAIRHPRPRSLLWLFAAIALHHTLKKRSTTSLPIPWQP